MIPVLHQQRAPVGLIFAEQLHHALGVSVATQEHVQIAVIDRIGVIGYAGVDKGLQRLFETETVDIHFHVIGDLIGRKTLAEKNAGQLLLRLFRGIKQEPLAALMEKAQGGGLQILLAVLAAIERWLLRPHI